MLHSSKTILLKNKKTALLRSPMPSDAIPMINFQKQCALETPFLLRSPEECEITEEQQKIAIEAANCSDTQLMLLCMIDNEVAGSCQIIFQKRLKTQHRGEIALAITKKYWGLGIGTAMIQELIAIAKQQHLLQLELEYIEGNKRGENLYKKMGFSHVGEHPNAIRLKDGQMLKLILMIKEL